MNSLQYFWTPEGALPPGVGFSLWGPAHCAWLLCAAALGTGLCRVYRGRDGRGRGRLRRGVGTATVLLEAVKDLNLLVQGAMSVYFLPLHLCGLAVFFSFWHSLRPGRTLGNFLYSTCMPGAAFALLFPDWTAFPPLALQSILAFVNHTLLVCYPLMLVRGGDLRPDARRLPACFALLLGLGGAVYLVDRSVQANYMFLLQPAPGSPLEWFARRLGVPGYVAGYIPMLAAVWLLLYLPFRPRPGSQGRPGP